ncbi:MAG: type II secretion system minor pseudopilin GspK [Burkholderiaceae bacterium]
MISAVHRQSCLQQRRERGVAVITALLLTTLAVTIVASLFWQQQVQVRTIENQRMQLQKQWILRGALDWAGLILKESLRASQMVDNLQQPWSVGLAETRLDSYVENGRSDSEASDATISGKISDAQSYLNLQGLSRSGEVQENEVAVFGRLLSELQIDPELARAVAQSMAAAQPKMPAPARGTSVAPPLGSATPVTSAATAAPTAASTTQKILPAMSGAARPLGINQIEDLLSVRGFTPAVLAKIRPFIMILPIVPIAPKLNVNTASAEVLAARIDTLSLPNARALVLHRNAIPFRDMSNFKAYLEQQKIEPDVGMLGVRSDFFLVDGRVKLNRAGLEVLALIQRSSPGQPLATGVLWIREQ